MARLSQIFTLHCHSATLAVATLNTSIDIGIAHVILTLVDASRARLFFIKQSEKYLPEVRIGDIGGVLEPAKKGKVAA